MRYETINTPGIDGTENVTIKLITDDGSVIFIPKDPANSDYQAYLAYLAEQEQK